MLGELRRRVDIGRSRRSDLLRTRSQMYALEARIKSLRSSLSHAEIALGSLTGAPAGAVLRDAAELPAPAYALADEAAVMGKRWDVKAAREKVEQAKAGLLSAYGGHLPSAYIEGSYMLYQEKAEKLDAGQGRGCVPRLPLLSVSEVLLENKVPRLLRLVRGRAADTGKRHHLREGAGGALGEAPGGPGPVEDGAAGAAGFRRLVQDVGELRGRARGVQAGARVRGGELPPGRGGVPDEPGDHTRRAHLAHVAPGRAGRLRARPAAEQARPRPPGHSGGRVLRRQYQGAAAGPLGAVGGACHGNRRVCATLPPACR